MAAASSADAVTSIKQEAIKPPQVSPKVCRCFTVVCLSFPPINSFTSHLHRERLCILSASGQAMAHIIIIINLRQNFKKQKQKKLQFINFLHLISGD